MMQDMKRWITSEEILVAFTLALFTIKFLHFVIATRHRSNALLCQACEKREDSQNLSQTRRPIRGFRFCTAHMHTIGSQVLPALSVVVQWFSFPPMGGRGVSKNVGNQYRCA